MRKNNSKFNAKVLLFGEYGIMEDSMGLSMPLDLYEGKLEDVSSHKSKQEDSYQHVVKYFQYLKSLSKEKQAFLQLDLVQFEKDLEKKIYFNSTIPQGFGVGSSGALVAAIFDRYTKDQKEKSLMDADDIVTLKQKLAIMESYFHGTSSGLDPLSCYLNEPLLIKSKEEVAKVGMFPTRNVGSGAVFLVDSGTPGKTKTMVEFFHEMKKNPEFRAKLKKDFIRYNEDCITYFLEGDYRSLLTNIKDLSKWVLENLQPMIPNLMKKKWEQGIETNKYYLKLCGSGGGGFFLGFSEDYESIKHHFSDFRTQIIHRF